MRRNVKGTRQVRTLADPQPQTVIGLSNISQGCPHRPLLNQTFLATAMVFGLDAAIANMLDPEPVATMAARVLLNRETYSDSFLRIVEGQKPRA